MPYYIPDYLVLSMYCHYIITLLLSHCYLCFSSTVVITAGALAGDARFSEESNVVLYDVECNGYEDSLLTCSHSLTADNSDISCDNAYVVCQGMYV